MALQSNIILDSTKSNQMVQQDYWSIAVKCKKKFA